MSADRAEFDLLIAGGGIVGASTALACAQRGLKVALVERDVVGSGATAAGMGHIVVMDDSEAQFALSRHSQLIWDSLAETMPAAAGFRRRGTLWIAADDEELAEAERKNAFLSARGVSCSMLSSKELAAEEPNLRPGLVGGLLIHSDSIVFAPIVAEWMTTQAKALGAQIIVGQSIKEMGHGRALLSDGREIFARKLVNATGAYAAELDSTLPVRKRKGQLAITDRYPGLIHHQIVELGYLKSAHSQSNESMAFNIQPRAGGQILIGSSRQFDDESTELNRDLFGRMLGRAIRYMPCIGDLKILRTWTGFRAATPDKLPLIGPSIHGDDSLLLATGHEGLGCTTGPATGEMIAAMLTGESTDIDLAPYLPARLLHLQNAQH